MNIYNLIRIKSERKENWSSYMRHFLEQFGLLDNNVLILIPITVIMVVALHILFILFIKKNYII